MILQEMVEINLSGKGALRDSGENTRWKERLGDFGLYFLERCQVNVHNVDNGDVYTLCCSSTMIFPVFF